MQPTFLPWVGYFALMDYVDEFIFLDHVQFNKRSWQQRNRIKTANGPVWLTVPIVTKGKQNQSINEAQINEDGQGFPDKLIKTIAHNYKKAPFYERYAQPLFTILSQGYDNISDLNIALTTYFCKEMQIKTPMLCSSDLNVSGQKAALLLDICQQLDATTYISPPGSIDYLEDSNDFTKAGIPISYFEYTHPTWPQLYGDFEPYMSTIDLLFNMGDKSLEVLREGIKNKL